MAFKSDRQRKKVMATLKGKVVSKVNVKPRYTSRIHSYIGLMLGEDIGQMTVSHFKLSGYDMEAVVDPSTGASVIVVPAGATEYDRGMFDSLVFDNKDLLLADTLDEGKQQIRQFIKQYKR